MPEHETTSTAAAADELAALRAEVTQLREQLAQLSAHRPCQVVLPTARQILQARTEKLARKQAQRHRRLAEQEAELLAGPKKFRVRLAGNPERTVGGRDSYQAQEKYRRHFGIRSTVHAFEVAAGSG